MIVIIMVLYYVLLALFALHCLQVMISHCVAKQLLFKILFLFFTLFFTPDPRRLLLHYFTAMSVTNNPLNFESIIFTVGAADCDERPVTLDVEVELPGGAGFAAVPDGVHALVHLLHVLQNQVARGGDGGPLVLHLAVPEQNHLPRLVALGPEDDLADRPLGEVDVDVLAEEDRPLFVFDWWTQGKAHQSLRFLCMCTANQAKINVAFTF